MQWEAVEESLAHRSLQMSSGDRPSAARQDTFENPALSKENTSIPVTPTVSNDNDVSVPPSTGAHGITRNPPQHVLEAIGAVGKGPEDLHSARENGTSTGRRPSSPREAASGARNGEELLRRLSLNGPPRPAPEVDSVDPRSAHPGLSLSGNVISAAFCVPYKIGYTTSGEWVRRTRSI